MDSATGRRSDPCSMKIIPIQAFVFDLAERVLETASRDPAVDDHSPQSSMNQRPQKEKWHKTKSPRSRGFPNSLI